MTVVNADRLFKFLLNRITSVFSPSAKLVFYYEGTIVDEAIWKLAEASRLPFKAYRTLMKTDRPTELIEIRPEDNVDYIRHCLLDQAAHSNGLILGSVTRNDRYKKPVVFRNRFFHPLEDLYEGEVMELIGSVQQPSSPEERILREDDRNGILSAKDPAKHKEYFKYSQAERGIISEMFGSAVENTKITPFPSIRRMEDLVR